MAIFGYLTANDPYGVPDFPPSILDDIWYKNLREYFLTTVTLSDNGGYDHCGFVSDTREYFSKYPNFLLFKDMSDLNNFVNTYTLTDPILLDDLAVWKAEHNIIHIGGFFDLSPGGGPILSINHIIPIDIIGVGF